MYYIPKWQNGQAAICLYPLIASSANNRRDSDDSMFRAAQLVAIVFAVLKVLKQWVADHLIKTVSSWIGKSQRMKDLREQCIKKRQNDEKRRACEEVWELGDRTSRECYLLQFRRDMTDAEKYQRQAEIIIRCKKLADFIFKVARDHLPRIEREYRELHYSESELQEHLTRTFV